MNFVRRIRALFGKRKFDTEMSEEMRLHLEQRTRENLAAGMSANEARYAALRKFGGVEQAKERARDQRSSVWLEQAAQDVRYAGRQLRRNPGFAATVIATLALGIGATTAIFSVVHAVLLQSLPYREPERVMRVLATPGGNSGGPTTVPDFVEWRGAKSFEAMSGLIFRSFNLTGSGEPDRIPGARISADYFEVLGVAPLLGRSFSTAEEQAPDARVVVIGHGLWQRRFAGDAAVLGRTLMLDAEPHTIIGVLPGSLDLVANSVQVWAPLALTERELRSTGNRRVAVSARLRPGVTLEQAQAEMQTIALGIEAKRSHSNQGWRVNVVPIRDQILSGLRAPLFTLFGAVGFVLLIACANIGNLLLARGEGRQQEIALRIAMGAGRWRIVRQLLTESLLLALLGGGLGVGLAFLGTEALVSLLPDSIPRLGQVSINGTVLSFAAVAVLLAGVLFGLVPSLRAARAQVNEGLKRGGRTAIAGGGRLRAGLVVTEIALALVLLIGAGLLGRSFWRMLSVDTGLRRETVVALQTSLPEARYQTPANVAAFGDTVQARLNALPELHAGALTSHVPLGSGGLSISVTILGRAPVEPQKLPNANYRAVTPGYFSTLGVPVIAGRDLHERDRSGSTRVVVINQTMARQLWPGENPIGARFTLDDSLKEPAEVVGVVADVRHFGPANDARPEFFVPFAQAGESFWRFSNRTFFVVARPRGDAAGAPAAMRRAIGSVDAELPLYRSTTLGQLHRDAMALPRVYGALLGGFAVAALVLAAIGIYGVVAYSVAQRTRELGVRVALGASRHDVWRLIVGGGARLAVIGVGLGTLGALGLTRLLTAQLFQVDPTDPGVFGGVAVGLFAIALLACWLPARRAAKVDPILALRAE